MEDKYYADAAFLHNMILIINTQREVFDDSTIDNALTWAWRYYKAVEEFGKSAYVVGKSGLKTREEVKPLIPKKVFGGEEEEML